VPSLTYSTDGGKETKVAPLYKAITSVGASEECDVYVPGDDKIAETHATILFDGRTFSIQAAARWNAVFVNGKRKKSARLTHRDTVLLGATKFRFLVHDEAHSEDLPPSVTGTVEQVNA
jgi:predicted component of type VI protein secretion system